MPSFCGLFTQMIRSSRYLHVHLYTILLCMKTSNKLMKKILFERAGGKQRVGEEREKEKQTDRQKETETIYLLLAWIS